MTNAPDLSAEIEAIDAGLDFCYASRSVRLQRERQQAVRAARESIARALEGAIASSDDELANQILSLRYLSEFAATELDMWIALKEDRASDAWTSLVAAQFSLRSALQAHERARTPLAEQHVERLALLESLLFPPQIFNSIGAVVTESHCTICESAYGSCAHIKGRAYMGKICTRRITKLDLREVSLIPRPHQPGNKDCRVVLIGDGKGTSIDTLTGERTVRNETPSADSLMGNGH